MKLSLFAYDIALFLLASIIYGIGFLLAAAAYQLVSIYLAWPFVALLMPAIVIVFILGVILGVAILNMLTPTMKAGYYAAPASKAFYIWTFYLSLNRLIFLQPIKNIVLYSAGLRYLAFHALGARLAYGTSISAEVAFTDLPMIQIGSGGVIGANSLLSGHYLNKGNLFIGPIRIGDRVNIGGYCRIGPNVEIGDDSWIGADCQISPMVTIGPGCTIEPMSVIPPGTRIAAGQTYPSQDEAVWA